MEKRRLNTYNRTIKNRGRAPIGVQMRNNINDPRARSPSLAKSTASDPRGLSNMTPSSSEVNLLHIMGVNSDNENNEDLNNFENALSYEGRVKESSEKNLGWGNYFGSLIGMEPRANFTQNQINKYINIDKKTLSDSKRLDNIKNIFNKYGIEPLVKAFNGSQLYKIERNPSIVEFLIINGYPIKKYEDYTNALWNKTLTLNALANLLHNNNDLYRPDIMAAFFNNRFFFPDRPISENLSNINFSKLLEYLYSLSFDSDDILDGLNFNKLHMFSLIRSLSTNLNGGSLQVKRQDFVNIIRILLQNKYPINGLDLISLYETTPNLSETTGPNVNELIQIIDLMAPYTPRYGPSNNYKPDPRINLSNYYIINGYNISPITASLRPNYFPIFKKLLEVGVEVDSNLRQYIKSLLDTLPHGFDKTTVSKLISKPPSDIRPMRANRNFLARTRRGATRNRNNNSKNQRPYIQL
jgi:hypothetical protein